MIERFMRERVAVTPLLIPFPTALMMLLVLAGPVGISFVFAAILFACRKTMKDGQTTRVVRSTMVLHGEYKPVSGWI